MNSPDFLLSQISWAERFSVFFVFSGFKTDLWMWIFLKTANNLNLNLNMLSYKIYGGVTMVENNKLIPELYQRKTGMLMRKGLEVSSQIYFFI
jgi:hypothetical protein